MYKIIGQTTNAQFAQSITSCEVSPLFFAHLVVCIWQFGTRSVWPRFVSCRLFLLFGLPSKSWSFYVSHYLRFSPTVGFILGELVNLSNKKGKKKMQADARISISTWSLVRWPEHMTTGGADIILWSLDFGVAYKYVGKELMQGRTLILNKSISRLRNARGLWPLNRSIDYHQLYIIFLAT